MAYQREVPRGQAGGASAFVGDVTNCLLDCAPAACSVAPVMCHPSGWLLRTCACVRGVRRVRRVGPAGGGGGCRRPRRGAGPLSAGYGGGARARGALQLQFHGPMLRCPLPMTLLPDAAPVQGANAASRQYETAILAACEQLGRQVRRWRRRRHHHYHRHAKSWLPFLTARGGWRDARRWE
jgi:hypothetical protein